MRTWNLIIGLGCFAGMSLGLSACGGFSNLGEGVGGEGGEGGDPETMTGGSAGKSMGSGGSTGGTMNPGSGGTMTPGSGGTMTPGAGGTMTPGAGGTMTPGAGGTMTPGAGGTMTPGAGGTMGVPPDFCATLPCGSMCLGYDNPREPDGTGFSGMCDGNGVCQREPTECTPVQACMTADECDIPVDSSCTMCADGVLACPEVDCVMGACTVRPPSCGSGQCSNAECGTPCDICAEPEMCPDLEMRAAVYATCSAVGKCEPGQAACGSECTFSSDCPQIGICRQCDATGQCGTDVCVNGRCQMVCPSPMGDQCQVDTDCPTPPPICELCPDGTCSGISCIEGTCVFGCQG